MEIRFAQTQKPDYQIQYSRIFRKNDDTTYIVIEKAIFYSAFIIRKLIDCDGNLSDEAENYLLEALAVQPFKLVDFLHRWPEEDSHDWDNEKKVVVTGKSVCNWLIHSYMFFVVFNEDNVIYSFSVTSDFDRNKILYGMLQHYGVPTRFIDVVDNHWIALWMGLNKTEKPKQYNQYYHYTERSIPLVELAKGDPVSDELLFQYVLLIAVPFSNSRTFTGIQSSADYIEVDLRQALPSTFLRPHAQHGLVLRRKVHHPTDYGTDAYDMAPAVIGIIKIRIDKVHEWMGNGELLTQNNLFPPPAYDYGFDLLLSRDDLFKDSEYSIAKYV